MNAQKLKIRTAAVSVASNLSLVVMKLTVGLTIGSVSVISEAIHSGMDLVAAVIAFFAVKVSSKPGDESHPYGHGKIENIAGTIEALLIFLAAGWIIYEAVLKLIAPEPMEDIGWGIAVMAVSAGANFIVSHLLFSAGKKTDSIALKADGMHLRTDVYTSAGVMAALAIYWLAGRFMPGLSIWWIDPVAAILVALLIVKAAYELTVESARDLMDSSLPSWEEEAVIREIEKLYPSVYGFHHIKTRKSGPYRFIDFHLMLSGDLSLREAHQVSDILKGRIKEALANATTEIHMEPCDHSCREHCRVHCFHLEKRKHVDADS